MTREEKELWQKKEHDEYEYLDSIDVKKYLKNNDNVWDCMDRISKEHNKLYCEKYNDDFGLFNYTNTDDFLDYIVKRYPHTISYNESIQYYICNLEEEENDNSSSNKN